MRYIKIFNNTRSSVIESEVNAHLNKTGHKIVDQSISASTSVSIGVHRDRQETIIVMAVTFEDEK